MLLLTQDLVASDVEQVGNLPVRPKPHHRTPLARQCGRCQTCPTIQSPGRKLAGAFSVGLSWLILASSCVLAGSEPGSEDVELFERAIRPLLHEHCYECHSATSQKLRAELHLDSRAGMVQGGESGPAIVPGNPADSLLLQAVRYESFEMPPSGKLSDSEISDLEQWIARGAPWPEESPPASLISTPFDWRSRAADHWAWQPLRSRFATNPTIDKFLQTAMAQRGLRPSAEAPRPVLIRRAWFDLIGLPPTPTDIERWLAEPSADWFERMVDELFASPHFGETWARHWLDLVRYGESCGHEFDYPIHDGVSIP